MLLLFIKIKKLEDFVEEVSGGPDYIVTLRSAYKEKS